MRTLFFLLIVAAASLAAETGSPKRNAVSGTAPTAPVKTEVMMIGVFHFANPQLDSVKSETINVMTPASQRYLEQLTDRIAKFKPTVVLLEFDPASTAEIQEKYERYRQKKFDLPANEIYQLGFRIARKANLSHVHSFDEQTVHWNAEPMFQRMEREDPQTLQRVEQTIAELGKKQQHDHATLSLQQLLIQTNSRLEDVVNKSLYIDTNHVGAGAGFEGADASASWWRRNFRMYANVQRHATPGARVVVIGGQGHTAILKDLLQFDRARVAVSVDPFL
jgi:Family of unknown function (DUF5694)